ncbi:ubiquitin-like protein 4A isoform X2 [Mya arenaria]|uniref:ubiquitin-like protein 4A isoform X2 n=1 Tax=Mya arenaria TaxID=6604 RepID=UPI0022E1A584|nr:ubiquitin-like protein 4A isoform X2 [Mya arenaria]
MPSRQVLINFGKTNGLILLKYIKSYRRRRTYRRSSLKGFTSLLGLKKFPRRQKVDDKALSYYKVTDGSKLYLMLKRPGGGMTPATCSSTPSHSPGTTSHMDLQSQEDTYTVTRHNDPTGFWRKLHTFLKRHFTERDAARVIKEFEKQFDCGINSLSLDDIERLASRQLHPTLGYSEQPIS